ncbi:MAG: hypothetical protein IBX44_00030 [Sulfurospirillum sp.]|nr:hypothetical protein [Sulfurospirillum sp.]
MNEIGLTDILIILVISYFVWVVAIVILSYMLGLMGLIIGVVLPPLIGFFIFPVATATSLVALTYFILIIYGSLYWYLSNKKESFPTNIESIPDEMIKLSDENLKLFHKSNKDLQKLNIELKHIQSLDITKRQDGFYSERSKAGQEANQRWNDLKSLIEQTERNLSDALDKQNQYKWKWIDIQELRNNTNSLLYSFILSLIILVVFSSFYELSFLTILQEFILNNSLITIFSLSDSLFELSGSLTLILFPVIAKALDILNNPFDKYYDLLKKRFNDLNSGWNAPIK